MVELKRLKNRVLTEKWSIFVYETSINGEVRKPIGKKSDYMDWRDERREEDGR